MWKARAVQWQKAGAKVDTVAPKEGIPLYISGFVIPKNAPNKDGAHVWLNEMLVSSAQEAFAEDMNAYATTVLLGGPTFHVMGPTVYNAFAGLTNWPFGAAIAFVLMAATLLLTLTSNWLAHRRYRT